MGNFDNVIFMHNDLSNEKTYQLTRFPFNYKSWSPENKDKIKKTNFISFYQNVVDKILYYEKKNELFTAFSGQNISMEQFSIKKNPIELDSKTFNVNCEEKAGEKMKEPTDFYNEIPGKTISNNSIQSYDTVNVINRNINQAVDKEKLKNKENGWNTYSKNGALVAYTNNDKSATTGGAWWEYKFNNNIKIAGIEIYNESLKTLERMDNMLIEIFDSNNKVIWDDKTGSREDNKQSQGIALFIINKNGTIHINN